MKRALLVPILLSVMALASCSGTAFVYVYNEHQLVNDGVSDFYPNINVTVNGETKYIPNGYDEEWVIEWFGFKLKEDVSVRASIVPSQLINGGLFETDFRVGDEDIRDVMVYECTGWTPNP
jgi:hypothetical protein